MKITPSIKNVYLVFWLAFIITFLVYPYWIFLDFSFSQRDFNGGIVNTFSTESWESAFSLQIALILYKSFMMALINTLFCFLFGFPIAIYIWRLNNRKKIFFYSLFLIPIGVSVLLVSYSWQLILGNSGVLNNLAQNLFNSDGTSNFIFNHWSIHVSLFGAYLSYFVLTFNTSLEKINPKYLINSQALGADNIQSLWYIILPMSKSGIITGALLVFLPTFAEYVIPSLLGGNKQFFVGTYAKYLFYEGKNWPAGSVILIISTIILMVFSIIFFKHIKNSFFENSK